MLISLSNYSNFLKNGHFPIFSLFWGPSFVTIGTVKVELIRELGFRFNKRIATNQRVVAALLVAVTIRGSVLLMKA